MTEFTEEEFVELVKKAEKEAETNLPAYRLKLALFAMLGYAVIFGVLVLLLIIAGGTVALAIFSSAIFLLLVKKKIIILILIAIWTLLRALWVKFDPPEGFVLKRNEFPELFEEVDDLSAKLDALKIHTVILENTLNASVVQTPRLGLFGGQSNTLILGLQLLLALPPEEMRAVLAHEFGHLSGNHSRFAGWIYRIRVTWERVMMAFDQGDSIGAYLMRGFFDWYAPKFSAYSFALARSNEYEADQAAAELTTPAVMACALVNVHARAPYIEKEYWQVYFSGADETEKPTEKPFEGLAKFLKKSPLKGQELDALVDEQMSYETHYADTHPSLRDRLEPLSKDFSVSENIALNAAELWLGGRYSEVLRHFDDIWLSRNEERWSERFKHVQRSQELIRKSKDVLVSDLDDDNLWPAAVAIHEFDGSEAAEPYYRECIRRDPDARGAHYYLGLILAARDDINALENLSVAMAAEGLWEDSSRTGYQLLHHLGEEKRAEEWEDESMRYYEVHRSRSEQLNSVTIDDEFKAANLNTASQEILLQTLKSNKNTGAVWLAEKVIDDDLEHRVYVLVVRPKGFYWTFQQAAETIAAGLPEDQIYFVVLSWGDTRKLAKKVKTVATKIK